MAEIAGKLGNYEVLRLLGQGKRSEVYLGQHIHLKTQAAIKIFHGDLSADERAARLAGLRRVATLRHPHIVRILEFGSENDMQFLVSENVAHGSLRQRHAPGEQLPLSTIMLYVKSVADALQYAHERGLVHGAVKPENMLSSKDDRVLLTDFRALPFSSDTENKYSVDPEQEDAAYLAPEQWQGMYSPASDQYALAVIVYEWLSGTPPFQGSPNSLREQHLSAVPPPLQIATSQVSQRVEQVLHKALAKDPRERYASAHAFALALAEAADANIFEGENTVRPSLSVPAPLHQTELVQSTLPTIGRTVAQTTVQQSMARSRLRPRTFVLALCSLLALLLISSGLFIFKGNISGFSQSGKSTPALEATLAAMSPQKRYSFVTSRQPVMDDHLNQAQSSLWKNEQKNQGRGSCTFQKVGGTTAYHLLVQANAPSLICEAHGSNFSNFAFQASMNDLDGHYNSYHSDAGLTFCDDSTGKNFYLFSFTTFGYTFKRYQAGQAYLIKGGTLSVPTGIVAHQLAIIADKGDYSFYLDGQFLASQTETTNCSGSIGFFATNNQKYPKDYIFKDARVWKL